LPAPIKQFVLIGNYPPDQQESMIRFADILATGLRGRGLKVETFAPQPVLIPKNSAPGGGLRKWLAYVDKWTLFPLALRRFVQRKERELGPNVFYHVCDHSNAPYLAHLPRDRSAITCHDVLAIRGALGYPESYCAASRTGVILQRWILQHLSRASRIGCVSGLTLRHLCEVAGQGAPKPGWTVLHNAFNAEFAKFETRRAVRVLERRDIVVPQPFLLHVGSNLPRKNRRLLLEMIAQPGQSWRGNVCFAGEAVDAELADEAARLGVQNRIHSVRKPDHETLCALYSLAHAFVFPSLSEGFGWPLIEAQACGAPVIASNVDPLPEVSGGAALHANPRDAAAFAAALQTLANPTARNLLVAQGLKNARRFDLATMTDGYLALYGLNGAQ
jgi:glycosyltransferase involved in cell wall biosynthesis